MSPVPSHRISVRITTIRAAPYRWGRYGAGRCQRHRVVNSEPITEEECDTPPSLFCGVNLAGNSIRTRFIVIFVCVRCARVSRCQFCVSVSRWFLGFFLPVSPPRRSRDALEARLRGRPRILPGRTTYLTTVGTPLPFGKFIKLRYSRRKLSPYPPRGPASAAPHPPNTPTERVFTPGWSAAIPESRGVRTS